MSLGESDGTLIEWKIEVNIIYILKNANRYINI